ncbi:MAG: thioesterase [Alphaproteobacteria bacterium]|nr:thioesterase [Alphaproteobacteria bacterium]
MKKFRIQKRLSAYQMDPTGSLRPLMLMNELQAAADIHAEEIGLGVSFCRENSLAWVALFFHVDIPKMPNASNDIVIETWPSSREGGLRAIRDFLITDAQTGEVLVRATSQWVMIDMMTRRPVAFAERIPNLVEINERALDLPFEKFPDFDPNSSQIVARRYDDYDLNQHVNNAVYAVWATEALGVEFRGKHRLRGISLNFKREISFDVKELNIETAYKDKKSAHRISSEGVIHAYVVCDWVPR